MGILRRTLIMGSEKDQIRFWDWNRVSTTLGQMFEPRPYLNRPAFAQFDPADELAKIDEIEYRDRRVPWFFDMEGDPATKTRLHGGELIPQLYSY
jgi:hypothetical protein